ncbi:MAG: prepilin-type N-terminal cleavage/methylation domain-containing protein [Methylococcales symbiont of Iophon sp. n. MRB-2018]|nr:MAG: prepilin-type N-terminal cleavage/methylation domain-containing protein [Methylococcales symbiont of Iophon sp. n. MRB-2018]KAF3979672.1 MAG: prepilin-type N-terminal cleavage/methylation domain-containing protein [Methylococcales symbiont of Iophon sp. n. MRB-2018]
MKLYRSQRAFSLIELLISITIGLLMTTATLSIYLSVVKADSDSLKIIRLNQDLRATMGLIVRDLRRAGFNANAATDIIGTIPSPFQTLNVGESCINYSYDFNRNGDLDANENFAFRLNAGAIEMSRHKTDCTNGGWETLTDKFLTNISVFNVTDINGDGITSNGVTTHQITITITANLIKDTAVTRTITEIVEIRNVEI